MTIKFYKTNEPYGFLNNFKKARMFIYGRWANNVEVHYQAQKTYSESEKELIYNAKTPREARNIGQTVSLIPYWYEIKEQVMYECTMAKYLQHKDLRDQLMATGNEELIEDSSDIYWGCGANADGLNMLGKILMRVREELKGE